jgi:shikimate dehydrogenase
VLAGWPLDYSLSPAMHTAAFAAAGIAARYVLRPTAGAELAALVDQVRSGALAGANVTVPHKVTARRLVDEAGQLAAVTGAVNTLVGVAAGVRGENTDVAGFLGALGQVGAEDGSGGRALVLGAGGAARAATVALAARGYRVTVLGRRAAQAAAVSAEIGGRLPDSVISWAEWTAERLVAEAASARLLVNATPIGSGAAAGRCPWPEDLLVPRHLAVMDMVAWPAETRLVTRARAAGARAAGGLEMLVLQAAEAWRLWTGLKPPVEAMRAAARAAASAIPSPP